MPARGGEEVLIDDFKGSSGRSRVPARFRDRQATVGGGTRRASSRERGSVGSRPRPTGVSTTSARSSYRMGETVEARYKNGSQYYQGNIVSVNSNGTYDIRYEDGDEEKRVPAYKIRRKAGAAASTSSKLREGDAVEARYKGREKYYKGKVSRDRLDGTYDINYDDGEKELRVEERLIRKMADDSISPRATSDSFREGEKVEARYKGREKYYPGKVSRDMGDGTYNIAYDDGEREMRVEEKLIRSKEASGGSDDRLREGDAVEARYRGREKYYKGTITRDRGDGTFDIDYDDGEKETRVAERLIRKKETRPSSRSRSRDAGSSRLSKGDKVKANYRERGKFYPGKITRDNGDDTYDIAYDDGERETRVPNILIRAATDEMSPVESSSCFGSSSDDDDDAPRMKRAAPPHDLQFAAAPPPEPHDVDALPLLTRTPPCCGSCATTMRAVISRSYLGIARTRSSGNITMIAAKTANGSHASRWWAAV